MFVFVFLRGTGLFKSPRDFFSLLGCAVRYRPLQGVPSRKLARANVTRAAVRTRPLQYLEVSSV
jgi:hypothetical protein